MFWRKKMAKKSTEAEPVAAAPANPKPVIAIEYNGVLYPSMQSAEGARAKADLLALLKEERNPYEHYHCFIATGVANAVDRTIENAERIHGILSRYLDAAKLGAVGDRPTVPANGDPS